MVLGPRIGNDDAARVPSRASARIPGLSGLVSPTPEYPKKRRWSLSGIDPYDLSAAFARLKQLLVRDTDGAPRADVPFRGFYLNILV